MQPSNKYVLISPPIPKLIVYNSVKAFFYLHLGDKFIDVDELYPNKYVITKQDIDIPNVKHIGLLINPFYRMLWLYWAIREASFIPDEIKMLDPKMSFDDFLNIVSNHRHELFALNHVDYYKDVEYLLSIDNLHLETKKIPELSHLEDSTLMNYTISTKFGDCSIYTPHTISIINDIFSKDIEKYGYQLPIN